VRSLQRAHLRSKPSCCWSFAAAVGCVVAALFVTAAVAAGPPRVRVGPIDPATRTLTGAVALATLVAVDPKSKLAQFRISCGWYAAKAPPSSADAWLARGKVRPGLWNVKLGRVSFNWETYAAGPASGVAHTVSLKMWEQGVKLQGWSGTLWLASRNPFISNGPTTDICRGVLG
jgi:hypothetical protein